MSRGRTAALTWNSRWPPFALPLIGIALAVLAWQATTRSVDFPVYYRAATDILAGRFDVYPPAVAGVFPPHGFRYAPAIAFLMAPIALVSVEAAALALFVLKLGALAYMSRVIARRCGRTEDAPRLGVLAFVVCVGYAAEEMRYGNVQLLCVAALVAAFDGVVDRRVVMPAGALALSIATKLAPLIMLPYLALRREWALCLVCLLMLAGLALAPAALVGQEANLRLLQHFAEYAREKVDEQDNYAWRGVVDRAALTLTASPAQGTAPAAPAGVTIVWLLGSAALLAAAWRALRQPASHGRTLMLELSIVLTLMLLISPHTQRRYFVTLFVPSATLLAVAAEPAGVTKRTLAWMRAGQMGIVLPGTVLPALFAGHLLTRIYQSLSLYFVGAVVLFIALVITTLDLKRASSVAEHEQGG